MRYPTTLTIAGSDSGGGAGIQADLKTISSLGVYGCSAITAITAQNTVGVDAVYPLSAEAVGSQIDSVCTDLTIDSVKTGMLFSSEIADIVADRIKRHRLPNLIIDPVMISTSGHQLIQEETIDIIRQQLFPLALLITPNLDEARLLAQMEIRNFEEMEQAGKQLLRSGVRNCLIKGGHLQGEIMRDLLITYDGEILPLDSPKIDTNNSHGTGCTLSSAIASHLSLGYPLKESVIRSKEYINRALAAGANIRVGAGHGPVNHFFAPLPLKGKG